MNQKAVRVVTQAQLRQFASPCYFIPLAHVLITAEGRSSKERLEIHPGNIFKQCKESALETLQRAMLAKNRVKIVNVSTTKKIKNQINAQRVHSTEPDSMLREGDMSQGAWQVAERPQGERQLHSAS